MRKFMLRSPTWDALAHVCSNLRAADQFEVAAQRADASPLALTRELFLCWPSAILSHVIWTCERPEPVAVVMILPTGTHTIANVALVATDRFDEVAAAFSRHVLQEMRPTLIKAGLRRLECRTHEDHTVSRAWLEWLGATMETLVLDGGLNGETFAQYAWTISQRRISNVCRRRRNSRRPKTSSHSLA